MRFKLDDEGYIQHQNPHIEWHKIIGLRNVIAHEYFDLDLNIIWDIVQKNIPELKAQIVKLIAK